MFRSAVPLLRNRLISTNGIEIITRHRSTLSSNSILRGLTKELDTRIGNGINTKQLMYRKDALHHQLICKSTFTSSAKLHAEKLSSTEVIGSKKATETIPPTDDVKCYLVICQERCQSYSSHRFQVQAPSCQS